MSEEQQERRNYRRLEDKKLEKIARLIEEENDPKTRTLLVTLQCIAEEVVYSRIGMTRTDDLVTTQGLTLKAHSKLMTQAVTVWKIAMYLTGAVNVFLLVVGGYIFNNIDQFKKDIIILNTAQKQLEIQHDRELAEHAELFDRVRSFNSDHSLRGIPHE